ncbi:hypothetical protein F1D05_13250 [Kribbella qitaiheensis]|uniref:Uncharacterized protein n=1 Tax=Kribbella qitaiheensis TaxID=1544730 RepID=A0A7G6WXI3_9ACTN|nr:hypothetical protein [Kribbella qitaiheensis]QNE18698.1 hypothetical protein F1D05_13250 [Kribbella qitaiheensis]
MVAELMKPNGVVMLTELRAYSDPYDALREQLEQLRGLIKRVPPLIQADRERRWTEVGQRPGDPETDMVYIYETEAGPEEGYGYAPYDQILYSTAIVTAWESFHVYLAHLLERRCLKYNLKDHPVLGSLVDAERSRWDRQFQFLVDRYDQFGGVKLRKLAVTWEDILHAQELRNALVHNLGYYTANYVKRPDARWPSEADEVPYTIPETLEELVNRQQIPLGESFTDGVITKLLAAAKVIGDQLYEEETAGGRTASG